jgi:hypothetical protein
MVGLSQPAAAFYADRELNNDLGAPLGTIRSSSAIRDDPRKSASR